MEDVAKHRWLFERREKDGTHRFYLRARVPKDLIKVLGKREIKISLGTSDRHEALRLAKLRICELRLVTLCASIPGPARPWSTRWRKPVRRATADFLSP